MPRVSSLAPAFLVLALLLLAGTSPAQSSEHVEIFGGYAYVNHDFSLTSPNGMQGWTAAADVKVAHFLWVKADFSGLYPEAKVYTFLFGPQASVRLKQVEPFAHILFGDTVVHSNGYLTSNNSATVAIGGGADFTLTRRLALRGQVDWLHTQFQTFDSQGGSTFYPGAVRVSTGIVVRF